MCKGFDLLLRLTVAAALAALVGYVTSLIPATGQVAPWLVVVTAIAVALAAQLGAELRAHSSPEWRTCALLVAISLAICLLYGLGVGLLMSAMGVPSTEMKTVTLILVPGVVAALIVGMLLGPLVVAKRPLFAWVIGLLAPFIVALAGAADALGMGVTEALTFKPCPPLSWCLDPGPWGPLQLLWPVGLVVGAWVGGIVWLTLGATCITRLRARRTLPHGG